MNISFSTKCHLHGFAMRRQSLPFHNLNNGELLLENLGIDCTKVDELSLTPNSYNDFIRECQNLSINSDDFYTHFNSQYYDISEFNRINHNKEASFNLIPSFYS